MKGLKKHKVICSLVIAIASVFLFCFNANAATIKVNGLDASQATVKGLQVSGAVSNIQYSWSIPDNENVADGDTAVFTLPNGFEVLQGFQGSVKAADGTVVGIVVINANSSTGTIKFNGTLTGKTQRQGTLQLWACKNRPSNTYQVNSPSLGPVTKFGRVVKDGLEVSGAVIPQGAKATNLATPSAAYDMTWYVLINPSGKSLKNVVITDHGSDTDFEIHAYQATVNGTTILGTNGIPCTPQQDYDTHTLTVNLGDINTPVLLTYYSSHFKTDTADIDTFNNEATVTSNGTVLGSTNAEVGWGITGTALYSNKPYVSSLSLSSSSKSLSSSSSSKSSSSSSKSLSCSSSNKSSSSSSKSLSSLSSKSSSSLKSLSSSSSKSSSSLKSVSSLSSSKSSSSSSKSVSSSSSSKSSSSSLKSVSSSSSSKSSSSSLKSVSSSSSSKSSSAGSKSVSSSSSKSSSSSSSSKSSSAGSKGVSSSSSKSSSVSSKSLSSSSSSKSSSVSSKNVSSSSSKSSSASSKSVSSSSSSKSSSSLNGVSSSVKKSPAIKDSGNETLGNNNQSSKGSSASNSSSINNNLNNNQPAKGVSVSTSSTLQGQDESSKKTNSAKSSESSSSKSNVTPVGNLTSSSALSSSNRQPFSSSKGSSSQTLNDSGAVKKNNQGAVAKQLVSKSSVHNAGKKAASRSTKNGRLPQTGEVVSVIIVAAGVVLVALGVYGVKKMK